MRKVLNVGCWSCFPSREESIVWAITGAAVAVFAIAMISLL
jgi:hypothetical protein